MAKQSAKGRKVPTKSMIKPNVAEEPEAEIAADDVFEIGGVETPVEDTPFDVEPTITIEPELDDPISKSTVEVSETLSPPLTKSKTLSSVIPAIFGGMVAGVVGFGVAFGLLPKPDITLSARISAQESQIMALNEKIAAIPMPNVSSVEAAMSVTTEAVNAAVERITVLESRKDDLSRRAAEGTSVSMEAYEVVLDSLKSDMENLRSIVLAEVEAARDQAVLISTNATRVAVKQALLVRIERGFESGAPLGKVLDDLAALMQKDVPAALKFVRNGTPTLLILQSDFPPLARAALATARSEGVSGEAESVWANFLRNQFDVRSVSPKEGNGTDAILSRAEATLGEGRLADTLAELNALPEVVRAELSDWITMAEFRVGALAAAASLSISLNDN